MRAMRKKFRMETKSVFRAKRYERKLDNLLILTG
jgi:hypothetical protein